MKCKNCGSVLTYTDGIYVCDSCGSRYSANDYYEKSDVYICYIDSDEAGRRTKDSIIAQDIYQKLDSNNISTFYSRISVGNLAGEEMERACNAAIHSTNIILVIGTQRRHFETLIERYSAYFSGRVVIPIYSEIDAYDIPKGISAIQALDYDKVGSTVDLTKAILNALGRQQEVDYIKLNKEATSNKKKTFGLVSVAIFILVLAVVVFIVIMGNPFSDDQKQEIIEATLSPEAINNNQYDEAISFVQSGNYVEAIAIFTSISGHKDSEKQLMSIYEKYAGYYGSEDEQLTLHLQVWDGGTASVEISKTTDEGKICKITETAHFQENKLEMEFNDSENNRGNVVLQLVNEKIVLKLSTTEEISSVSMKNIETEFNIADRSDKPLVQWDKDKLKGLVAKKTSLSELKQNGYELEVDENLDVGDTYVRYRIKDTNILLAIYKVDYTISAIATVEDPLIFGVSAPASIICPDLIGKSNKAFVENDILYVPDGELTASGRGIDLGNRDTITESTISENTNICFTSKATIGEEYFLEMVKFYIAYKYQEEAEAMFKASHTLGQAYVYSDIEAENAESYLICVKCSEILPDATMPAAYYIVNKSTEVVEPFMEIPLSDLFPDDQPLYMNFPEMFSDFL